MRKGYVIILTRHRQGGCTHTTPREGGGSAEAKPPPDASPLPGVSTACAGKKVPKPEMTARKTPKTRRWGISQYLMSVVGFALLAVPTWWLWSAIRLAEVPSESMEPTLLPGDVLAVRIDAYRHDRPHRGDIVILREPKTDEWMVKRVVGEPGEELLIASGHVIVPGGWLDEPYIREPRVRERPIAVRLAADEIFVMGDNRDHSDDSRDFGPVKLDRLVGRVAAIILPWSRRDTIPRFIDAVPEGGAPGPGTPAT